MPAVSEEQRRLAGMALAMKRGETPFSASGKAHEMMRSMSTEDLRHMASKPIQKR